MNIKQGDLVAVFGSLRKGHGNNILLQNEKFLGTTKTKDKFKMFSFGAFPGLNINGDTNIVVDVYRIKNNHTPDRLDMLEGYPDFYNRKKINTKFGDAWIYFNEDNLEDRLVVENGDWTLYCINKKEKHADNNE